MQQNIRNTDPKHCPEWDKHIRSLGHKDNDNRTKHIQKPFDLQNDKFYR